MFFGFCHPCKLLIRATYWKYFHSSNVQVLIFYLQFWILRRTSKLVRYFPWCFWCMSRSQGSLKAISGNRAKFCHISTRSSILSLGERMSSLLNFSIILKIRICVLAIPLASVLIEVSWLYRGLASYSGWYYGQTSNKFSGFFKVLHFLKSTKKQVSIIWIYFIFSN